VHRPTLVHQGEPIGSTTQEEAMAIPTRSRLSLAEELEQLPAADTIVGDQHLSVCYDRACDIAAEALAECERYESVLLPILRVIDLAERGAGWSVEGMKQIRDALKQLPQDPS
jgi:hypothetical protein